jgi:ABC-type sugar transport system ATPase subunit
MTQAVVRVENLLKRFPGTIAVQDVSFAIAPGTVHALVGENGAGKSTVIKMLSGVYLPDAGRIIVKGEPRELTSPDVAQEAGISTVHQERSLISNLSALENIFLGREVVAAGLAGRIGVVDRRQMQERVETLCRDFDFDIRQLNRPVEGLTALLQQVVEIIKALAFNSKLIILDEPTGGLSEAERMILFQQMRRLRDRGTAVLWVTHHLEDLAGLADAVTVLRDGALVGTLDGAEATAEKVVRMMVGRDVDSIESLVAESKAAGAVIGDEILQIDGLGAVSGISDLSLSLRQGEILGIGGLQGAGSNRLVEAIIGATRHTGGIIRMDGKRLSIRRTRDAFRAGIAYVPNERKTSGILPLYSIAENITISSLDRFTRAGVVDRKAVAETATEYFDRLRIRATGIGQQILRLSGGNQQKAIIARALATRPRVIVFNEPTEGVDIGAKVEIYRLIHDFVNKGGAAIVRSSDLVELLGLSDRVLVMRAGRIVGEMKGLTANTDHQTATRMEEHFMSLAAASH